MKTFKMKRYVAIVVLFGFAIAPGSSPAVTGVERDLTKLLADWATARVKGDVSFLEKFYAKELVITGADGSLIPRDTDIALFKKGEVKPDSIQNDDLKITLYCNDVAVVSGRETVKGSYKGNYGEGSLRFLDVLVLRDSRWQLISTQATWIDSK